MDSGGVLALRFNNFSTMTLVEPLRPPRAAYELAGAYQFGLRESLALSLANRQNS